MAEEKLIDTAEGQNTKYITTSAPRGEILDRYGRVIATNKQVFNLDFNVSGLSTKEINDSAYKLVKILEANGEEYVDNFPIQIVDGEYIYVEEHYVRDANGTYIIPYTEAYNVTTGQIGIETISVTLDVMMKLSSTGLTKSDSGYSDTFAYWVENLIVGLLSEIDLLKNTEFVITLPQRPVEIKVAVEAAYGKKAADDFVSKNYFLLMMFACAEKWSYTPFVTIL